jgi:hypothetical protein
VVAAAAELGTTVDAIRKRVQRGTIPHERDDEGRVWILLDTRQDTTGQGQDTSRPPSDATALISRLEDEVRFLREELARKDTILLRMAESIPQLEAPREPSRQAPQSTWQRLSDEPREAPDTATEQPGRVEPQTTIEGAQEGTERPWWRRVFGP